MFYAWPAKAARQDHTPKAMIELVRQAEIDRPKDATLGRSSMCLYQSRFIGEMNVPILRSLATDFADLWAGWCGLGTWPA